MQRLARLAWGTAAALATLGVVVALIFAGGGGMFSPGALNGQGHGSVRLGGVSSHAEIGGRCSACHVAPWSGEAMANRCLDCHADVRDQLDGRRSMHGLLPDGTRCRGCHTEHNGAQAVLTSLAKFNHDFTGFKLTGAHGAVGCKSCHANEVYKGTPQSCSSCHAEPQVHKGRFGADCASCHSTTAWGGTAVALAKFDHDLAAFKLTGKHRTVGCKACHASEVYKGTPQSCSSCHAEPQVHKGRYGTECASCHSTSKWEGATFKHTFPLNHGERKAIACATCHTTPNDFRAYTCYGCHEHEPTRIARKHKGIANFENCVRCHANGREHDGRGVRDDGAMREPSGVCPACTFAPLPHLAEWFDVHGTDNLLFETVQLQDRAAEDAPGPVARVVEVLGSASPVWRERFAGDLFGCAPSAILPEDFARQDDRRSWFSTGQECPRFQSGRWP